MTGFAFRNKVAIVGVGVTRAVRHADVPVGALAVSTSIEAIKDAGLTAADIDGVACGSRLPAFSYPVRTARPGIEIVDSTFLIDHMGLQPIWSLDRNSFPPVLADAVLAVASGGATCVLVNRTLHNPSGRYSGFESGAAAGEAQWKAPYGLSTPSLIAFPYMEYQQRFGARREHMATLVTQVRQNVQRIPEAYWCGKELTFDQYMASRMISEPMCLYDYDLPVDGSGSVVVTTAERARDLPNRPVYIAGWARVRNAPVPLPGSSWLLDDFYERGFDLADRLWRNSGWRPEDLRIAQFYDGFSPFVWFWLEALGFCPVGEAWSFIQDGRIASDGEFPLNSGGGNLGWGRMHGFPHVLECYLQLAGRAGARQIDRAERAISTYAATSDDSGSAFLYTTDPTA